MLDKHVLEERRKCITGTDIAAICGLLKWSSPLTVFCDKLGLIEPQPDNKYMEWGRRLERVVADKYAEENGVKLNAGNFIRNGIYGGTPDYLCETRLIEIKTTSARNATEWGEVGTDQIPEYYMTQVQWYLMLTDRQIADVCVLIGGNDYRVYTVKRDDRLIGLLKTFADDFWNNHVLPEIQPDVKKPVDNQLMSRLYDQLDEIILDRPAFDGAAKALADLKDKLRGIQDEIAHYEAVIKQEIGVNAGIKGPCWKATWKCTSGIKKIDWEKIALDCGATLEQIAKHTKTNEGVRRFCFTSKF